MKIAVFYNFPAGGAKRVVYEEVKSLSNKHNIDLFRLCSKKESFLNIDVFCRKTFVYDFKIESSLPLFLSRLHKDFKNYENLTRKIRKYIDYETTVKAKCIVTNSFFMQKFVKNIYGKNAQVCYPGVDTNIFKKYNKKQNKILFVGNKNKIDIFELVEEALKIVNQKFKVKLEIIDKRGFINNDFILARKYSEALVTLCTSQIEAFGLKALESLACETPVIELNKGGYKEIIDNGQNGFLVEGSANKIAEKIIYLLQNPKIAEKMGKRGREIVLRKWKWEYHIEKLEKILIETAIK